MNISQSDIFFIEVYSLLYWWEVIIGLVKGLSPNSWLVII